MRRRWDACRCVVAAAAHPQCHAAGVPLAVLSQDGPCRGRTHAGAQCVDGCLQRLGRGHARAVAQQHLLGHIQQFGVEGALGLGQQVLHSPARVATQALRHRDFGRLVDPLQAVAHQLAVGLMQVAGIGHQLCQAARVGIAHAQGAHPAVTLGQLDGRDGQHGQQAAQVAGGFKVEGAGRDLTGHATHRFNRLRKLPLLDELQRARHLRKPTDACAAVVALQDAGKVGHAALDALAVVFGVIGKRQQHQRLVVEQLGVNAQHRGARQHLGGGGAVAHVIRHHPQLLQPHDRVGREGAGRAVGLDGLRKVAHLHLRAAQHVVGVGKRGVLANQLLQGGDGARGLA